MTIHNTVVTDDFDTFDPNNPSHAKVVWGLYTPRTFRTYVSRGPAVNAFNNSSRSKLYMFDLDLGRWVEKAVKGRSPNRCEVCGRSTVQMRQRKIWVRNAHPSDPIQYEDYEHNSGRWDWTRDGNGKILPKAEISGAFRCEPCDKVNRGY